MMAVVPCLAFAQKKEIGQAKAYIKSGSNYDTAEKLMTDLLEVPDNRTNEKIYLVWYQSVQKQYEAANEQLYLKQKYDTAAFFNLTRRMYTITETLDSLDAQPDEKGRIKLSYRKVHAEEMNRLRPNLYYGGTYNLRKDNYAAAFDFFDTYLTAGDQPLFTGYDYLKTDSLMPQAAYWATFSGYKLQDAEKTLRFSQLALRDASKAQYVRQYVCEAYLLLHNDSAYVADLREGFRDFPEYPYFFPRLIDHYNDLARFDVSLELADQALQSNPTKPLFLLAKSLALLNLERYDDCVTVSEQLIEQDETLPEPYYNIATTYLNQALALEKLNEPRKYHAQITELYGKARPYMEKYRELAPDDDQRWAPALYRVYLNLNMGKQFEEIDRLMKK